jgi:hypothetical protein
MGGSFSMPRSTSAANVLKSVDLHSTNPVLVTHLEHERSERKEEIAALKSELLAKVEIISSLVSKALTAEGIASQNELARGLMQVTQGLEVVERGLDEERQTRKDEIATLTQTLPETTSSATVKLGEEFSIMRRGSSSTSTADEISDSEPQRSDISEENYSKLRQAQDQMSDEIASLAARIDSAPWTKTMEMQKEIADLRVAWISDRDTAEAFQLAGLKDIQTKSEATALQFRELIDGLFSQVLEHATKLDGLIARVEAAESGISKQRDFEDGILRQLNTHIAESMLAAEASSEVHDQITETVSDLSNLVQAFDGRLQRFEKDSIDAVDMKIMYAQVLSAETSPEARVQIAKTVSDLSKIEEAFDVRLKRFEKDRIDKIADDMKIVHPQVLAHGQSISDLRAKHKNVEEQLEQLKANSLQALIAQWSWRDVCARVCQ